MTPDQFLELAKSYGPVGALVAVIVASWRQRTPDTLGQDHDEIERLREAIGNLRDRVSRIEGAMGKDGK